MKIRAYSITLLLLFCSTFATLAQAQTREFNTLQEYKDWLAIYNEKDNAKKAASAERFFIDHKEAAPDALTQVYTMMFLAYANDNNWGKVLETYDRMSLAPKLTDADKERFAKIAEIARTKR